MKDATDLMDNLRKWIIKKKPYFIDISQIRSITLEARKYFGNEGSTDRASVVAIYSGSPVGRVIGNFFLKINKPPIPMKIFSSKDKAIEWMKDFID